MDENPMKNGNLLHTGPAGFLNHQQESWRLKMDNGPKN